MTEKHIRAECLTLCLLLLFVTAGCEADDATSTVSPEEVEQLVLKGEADNATVAVSPEEVEQLVLKGEVNKAIDLVLAQPDLTRGQARAAAVVLAETVFRQSVYWSYHNAHYMSPESLGKYLKTPPFVDYGRLLDIEDPDELQLEMGMGSKFAKLDPELHPKSKLFQEYVRLGYFTRPPDFALLGKKMRDESLPSILRIKYALRLAELNGPAGWEFIDQIWMAKRTPEDRLRITMVNASLYWGEVQLPRTAKEKLLRIVVKHCDDWFTLHNCLVRAIAARPKIEWFIKELSVLDIPYALFARAALGSSDAEEEAKKYFDLWQEEGGKSAKGSGLTFERYLAARAALAASGSPVFEQYVSQAVDDAGPFKEELFNVLGSNVPLLPEPQRFNLLSQVLKKGEDGKISHLMYAGYAIRTIQDTQGRNAYRVLLNAMKANFWGMRHQAAFAIVTIESRQRLEEEVWNNKKTE